MKLKLLDNKLKVSVLFLASIFPVTLGLIGYFMGIYLDNISGTIIFSLVGIALGLGINYICFYRKLFTLAIYYSPIPTVLFYIMYGISNVFLSTAWAFSIGLLGLSLGILFNKLLLYPYRFYHLKDTYLAFLYLFFSIVVFGLLMGIPILNLLLGILAGNYMAIRILSGIKSEKEIHAYFKNGARFTASVLLVFVLLSWIISFSEIEQIRSLLHQLTQINASIINIKLFLLLNGLLMVVLQYYLTYFTAETMIKLWRFKKFTKD